MCSAGDVQGKRRSCADAARRMPDGRNLSFPVLVLAGFWRGLRDLNGGFRYINGTTVGGAVLSLGGQRGDFEPECGIQDRFTPLMALAVHVRDSAIS